MEVASVSAALRVLFPRLVSEAEKQIKLFRHYKKDIEKLKKLITMVQSFLNDAEKKQVTDETVKLWLQNLEGVAFDADNVLDEFDYQHLSKQVHARHKVKKKMGNAFRPLKLMKKVRLFFSRNIRRHELARKIKDINKNFDEINKEARDYGLQISVAGASHAPSDGSAAGTSAGKETTSKDKDPVFIGRENDVSEIVKMMTTPPNGNQVFSILPIVGMGGIGKTTVAQHVLDHDDIKAHFDKLFWVHVSENFDASIIFSKILASLLKETRNVNHVSRQNVLEKLENTLGADRFLLVLDDVWNKDRKIWDSFINNLRNICSATGNGIIVTTRSEDVASVVTRHPMHRLNNLSNDECWSIIKEKTFPDGSIPSYFQTTGVSIAKGCQGLPLAANLVGGLLEGQPIDKWHSIEKACLSNLGDEYSVSNILKLSYNHLSSQSLKKCFAYCSIFPKGFSLEREQLVEMWMAEGFLAGNDDMENVGNKFFDLLLHNSLVQVVERKIFFCSKYYSMHDLVHDLAFSILNSSHQVRYLCLQPTGAEPSHIPEEQARSCIRSLLLIDKLCAGMLSDFKSLHVLILMTHGGEELPSSIGELIHLRFIDISRIRMECLPDSIGQLYHLQTLRAHLRKLPDTLKHLIGLRHLHIPRIELPPEMGRLTSLRTLRYFGVGDENGRGIAELGSLKNLEGELEIYNLENVHDKEEAKRADLLQKPNILKLTLKWGQNREGENNDADVLGGLQPHPNLRHLEIWGFRGRSFSSWSSTMIDLDKLTTIWLERCEECEQIPTLGHLPHLENLYLHHLPNVRSIESLFYGTYDIRVSNNTFTHDVFPALQMLELKYMKNLAERKEAELPNATMNGRLVFPRLEELKILCVRSALPWTSICGINLKYALKKLYIYNVELLICLPDWFISNNQNLSQLTIASCDNLTHLVPRFRNGGTSHVRDLDILWCPKLRELPNDLCSLNALEKLRIRSCPILERIPYPDDEQLLGLSRLRVLKIHNCKGLTNVASKMIESCAPSLETLSLTKLTSLENMEDVIGCFEKMSRLSKLKILDVPITTNPIGPYPGNLTKLSMSTCDEYSSSVVDSILEGSISSLRRLELYGKDDSDLPNQLRHLTALSELRLDGFGNIEALPEWFGDSKFSSSLQELYLANCKNLRHLPSKEAMLRLTKLSLLETSECPLLKLNKSVKRNSNNGDDSEWPKISHIRRVIVDRQDLETHYQ